MTFTKDSVLVKTWVSLVLTGTFTLEQVPKLFNLKSVVSEIVNSLMQEVQHGYTNDRAEHEEFKRRMEDEHKRINHRLTDLEETVRQIGELTTSVHSLAQSVEQLVKSQNRQESRLEELENRDGATWRKVKWYLLTLAIGAVFGLLVAQIGL